MGELHDFGERVSVQSRSARNRLSFPARVWPKLRGGRVHQVLIDDTGLTISTLSGFYGNKQSQPLQAVPRGQLIAADYMPPRWWRGARCRIEFRDDGGQSRTLLLAAVDSEVSAHAYFTALVAQVLNAVRSGTPNNEGIDYEYNLTPLRMSVKLFQLPLILTGLMLIFLVLRFGFGAQGVFFAGFLTAFFGSAAIAATLIDGIRLHTAWPLPLKVVASLFSFTLALLIFLIIMGLLDSFV